MNIGHVYKYDSTRALSTHHRFIKFHTLNRFPMCDWIDDELKDDLGKRIILIYKCGFTVDQNCANKVICVYTEPEKDVYGIDFLKCKDDEHDIFYKNLKSTQYPNKTDTIVLIPLRKFISRITPYGEDQYSLQFLSIDSISMKYSLLNRANIIYADEAKGQYLLDHIGEIIGYDINSEVRTYIDIYESKLGLNVEISSAKNLGYYYTIYTLTNLYRGGGLSFNVSQTSMINKVKNTAYGNDYSKVKFSLKQGMNVLYKEFIKHNRKRPFKESNMLENIDNRNRILTHILHSSFSQDQ